MTFPPAPGPGGQAGPEASRFWSLTAYAPEAIELVPNPINKYVVASYTGAQLNPDGSLFGVHGYRAPTPHTDRKLAADSEWTVQHYAARLRRNSWRSGRQQPLFAAGHRSGTLTLVR